MLSVSLAVSACRSKQMWNFVFFIFCFQSDWKKQKPVKMKDNRRRHLLSTQQTPPKRKRQRFNRSIYWHQQYPVFDVILLCLSVIQFHFGWMADGNGANKTESVNSHENTINSKFDISHGITSHTRRRYFPQLINHWIARLASNKATVES